MNNVHRYGTKHLEYADIPSTRTRTYIARKRAILRAALLLPIAPSRSASCAYGSITLGVAVGSNAADADVGMPPTLRGVRPTRALGWPPIATAPGWPP
eukprot:3039923-Prymnesium_polylepis.1